MTNRRFFTDLKNLDQLDYSETLFDSSEFNSHNVRCYFFFALHVYFMY
jgi:hypothetical protein